MDELFLALFNRAVAAGWLVLAVLLLRLLLRRAPKSVRVLLWGFVALRLLLPASLKSPASLVPSTQTLPREALYAAQPQLNSGILAVNAAVNPVLAENLSPDPVMVGSVNPLQVWTYVAGLVWLVGLAAMLLYMLVSTLRLRRRVAESVPLRDNIRLCARVESPFVLGLLRPTIYLPYGLDGETQSLVLAHEQGHIERRDHWLKPLGFLLLAVYWFQPLLWLGYRLFCLDLELACDERVLRRLGQEAKKPYARALVACSAGGHIAACPVAFNEGGVKGRVKNALRFRPVSRWLMLLLIPLFALLALLFLTDPGLSLRPEAEKVERIELFDGNTGRALSVTDRGQIERIVSMTRALELRRRGVSLGYTGYSYRVTFEPSGGSFILNSDDTVRKDPFFYEIKDGTALYAYIGGLYGETVPDERKSAFLDPNAPQVAGFSCVASDGESSWLLAGEKAEALYRLVSSALAGQEEIGPDAWGTVPQEGAAWVNLIFTSPGSGEAPTQYGWFALYADDSCEFNASVYMSSVQKSRFPAGTYQAARELLAGQPTRAEALANCVLARPSGGDGTYTYDLYDLAGHFVQSIGPYAKPLNSEPLSHLMRPLIALRGSAGPSRGTTWSLYFDPTCGALSGQYFNVLLEAASIYCGEGKSVRIYDPISGELLGEITRFSEPFAPTADSPFLSAAFNEHSELVITYLAGEDYHEVTDRYWRAVMDSQKVGYILASDAAETPEP